MTMVTQGTITSITRTAITVIPMLMTTSTETNLDHISEEDPASLFRLMTWLSPAFPVGAFSYS